MITRLLKFAALLVFIRLMLAQTAWAVSCNATFSEVNFGTVDVTSSANPLATTTGNVVLTCSRPSNEASGQISVCLGLGGGAGGADTMQRTMANGSNKLSYNLYKDATYSQIWGSAAIFTASGSKKYVMTVNSGSSTTVNDTLYARLPSAPATTPVGAYTSSFSGNQTSILISSGNSNCNTGAAPARATGLVVNATVSANCTLTANDLNFGSVQDLSANRDQTSAISVSCTNGAAYSVALNNGVNFSTSRRMRQASTSNYINYGLFRDAARSQAWSTGTGNIATCTGTGTAQSLTVYGRVPTQTVPQIGTYSDTVIATITF